MRELYTTDYVNKYANKKKKYKTQYVIVSIIVSLLVVGIIVFYALEPYGTKLRIPLLVALMLLIILFVSYSFLHFGYTYGSVKNYYNFLVCSVCGKRSFSKVTVLNVLYQPLDKGGFDCYRLIALEWSEVANDYVERTLYVDCQVLVDDLKEGDILSIYSNSNYLLAYKKEN